MDQEMRFHLEALVEDLMRGGVSRAEAMRRARMEFGGIDKAKEECRAARGVGFAESLAEDLRFGARTLRKNPTFTIAAVLAIGLGVGLNVGIFSVLNGATMRLLPIPAAKRMVSVDQTFYGNVERETHGETSMFSYPEYLEYREQNHVFSGLLAYQPFAQATLGGGKMQQLLGAAATCNYFDVLHVYPGEGRGFVDSDCTAAGQGPVVVISDDLWRKAFATDPALVGKPITLSRTLYTVIGIMPPGFRGTEPIPCDFWAPITMQKKLNSGRDYLMLDNVSWLAMLGRLQEGATISQARADLDLIARRIDQRHPGRTTSLAIQNATFFSRADEKDVYVPVAAVILAAFALVLVVACANVANLLLARASVRQKEIALRLSVGASRWRLVRQLLTESLLLSLIGGATGSLLALWLFAKLTRLAMAHLPHRFPPMALDMTPDLRVLSYALGLMLVTTVAFGLVPAVKTAWMDLSGAMKSGGATSSQGTTGVTLRNGLVGAQIAVCMILVLAAGLLTRGLEYTQSAEPGFEMRGVTAAFLALRAQGYESSRATSFVRSLRERITGVPGVTLVAQAETAPLSDDRSVGDFTIPGWSKPIQIEYNHVSPEYFQVVGTPLSIGRGFTTTDTPESSSVMITASTALRLWPSENPLGKTLRDGNSREYSVIGVVRDAQVSHLGERDTLYLFFPAGPGDDGRCYLLARFAGDYEPISQAVRDAVRALDPDLAVKVNRLDDYLEFWRAPSRIVVALSAGLGALALLLAVIGVYGTVSYNVNRRVREIGIRMALGANRTGVMRAVFRQAMRPVLIGGAIGILGCAAVSKVLSNMLFGISPHDPVAFVAGSFLLLLVAFCACWAPARQATRVDPTVTLRCE